MNREETQQEEQSRGNREGTQLEQQSRMNREGAQLEKQSQMNRVGNIESDEQSRWNITGRTISGGTKVEEPELKRQSLKDKAGGKNSGGKGVE